MSGAVGRAASKVGSAAAKSVGKAAEAGAKSGQKDTVYRKGARRDPELYVKTEKFENVLRELVLTRHSRSWLQS